MSRYVTKKHGLVIGSGNVFFYRDDVNGYLEFPAIVWAQNLYFPRYSTAHAGMRSLAEQFIWQEWEEQGEPIEFEGMKLPQIVTRRALRPYPRDWLDTHAPGYGVKTEESSRGHGTIFFSRRSHAVDFTIMIDEMLDKATYI